MRTRRSLGSDAPIAIETPRMSGRSMARNISPSVACRLCERQDCKPTRDNRGNRKASVRRCGRVPQRVCCRSGQGKMAAGGNAKSRRLDVGRQSLEILRVERDVPRYAAANGFSYRSARTSLSPGLFRVPSPNKSLLTPPQNLELMRLCLLHQLSQLLAGIKHAGLHGGGREC